MGGRVVAMRDLSNEDPRSDRLRALAHDLRGAIGALDHQTQLLSTRDLASELQERSIAVLEANIAELRRVLEELEDLTHRSPSG